MFLSHPPLSFKCANFLRSRQIRPPIYSLKQTKLRKRRVLRYAILYFVMLIIFIALIVAPLVGGPKINNDINSLTGTLLGGGLAQPIGLNNNDTFGTSNTGLWKTKETAAATAAAASSTKAARFVIRNY